MNDELRHAYAAMRESGALESNYAKEILFFADAVIKALEQAEADNARLRDDMHFIASASYVQDMMTEIRERAQQAIQETQP